MELTLLVLIITIIVSIRRSAWYQRYKVRAAARVVSDATHRWIMVDAQGMATLSQDKPSHRKMGYGGTWALTCQHSEKPMFGYYPALRNQVFHK